MAVHALAGPSTSIDRAVLARLTVVPLLACRYAWYTMHVLLCMQSRRPSPGWERDLEAGGAGADVHIQNIRVVASPRRQQRCRK